MAAELSLETQAILNRLKNEGDLIRNSGKNSIKQVNINLEKFSGAFAQLNQIMKDNTAMIKQTSDAEAKIQQEAAERARRQGEIDELTQKDRAKAAELRAKADALRAKQDLKEARGTGIFGKLREKNNKDLLKMIGGIGALGLIGSQIAIGALDQLYPPNAEGKGGWRNIVSDLPGAIEDASRQAAETFVNEVKNAIPSWTQVALGLLTGGVIGTTYFGYRIAKGLGEGREAAKNKAEVKVSENNRKRAEAELETEKLKAKRTGTTGTGQIYDVTPDDADAPNRTPRATAENQLRINVKRPTPGLDADTLFETAKKLGVQDAKISPAQMVLFDDLGGMTAEEILRDKGRMARVRDFFNNDPLGQRMIKSGKILGPLSSAFTAYQIWEGLGGTQTALNDAQILSLMQGGSLQKDRVSAGEIATMGAASAASTAAISAAITSFTGPGAGVAAGGGAIAGGFFGTISGVIMRAAQEIDDFMNDIDSLPNEVEEAIKRQNRILQNEGLSTDERTEKLNEVMQSIGNVKESIGAELLELETEIAAAEAELEAGPPERRRGQAAGWKRQIQDKIDNLRQRQATRQLQLQNTEAVQRASEERINQVMQMLGKVTTQNSELLAGASGGSFINTQVINNTYNNQFVQNSRNNWNSGQVVVENMTGGSGEQVALG